MKECLNCKREFEPKKETAKYCSTSCRVMWNRKNGNKTKQTIQPFQMQVLYNLMVEKLSNVNVQPTPLFFDAPKINNPTRDEPKPYEKPALRRSFDYYKQARTECETQEQWEQLIIDIHNDQYLSTKQKNILTT